MNTFTTPTHILIDDLRSFTSQPPVEGNILVARTSQEGLDLLKGTGHADSLWLDHDLGGKDTIMPVIDWLIGRASAGEPFSVGRVFVHTSNAPAGKTMVESLRHTGYHVTRLAMSTTSKIFINASNT